MDIPREWAGSHDCEFHYSLTEQLQPRSLYTCSMCGGRTWLHDEQWQLMQARVARQRAAIEALALESPERRSDNSDSRS